MAADCPVQRTSPNAAPVYDVLQSFMLTALTDGRRFSHIERLREDPTIPELFGVESVVGDDTVRRFFKSVDPVLGAEWIARHAKPMWGALPDPIILDWDSTVQPKYGHQEGAEIGYNPGKQQYCSLRRKSRDYGWMELDVGRGARVTQRIAGHFPFESAGNAAAPAAHGSLLKDFQQDATEPARRLLRGERLAGGPVCDARLARCA